MKQYILAGLLMFPMAAFAADQINLEGFESVTVFCDATVTDECPELPTVSQFSKSHGYQHPWRAEDLKQDCTVCHSMYGEDGLVTTRDIGCASVDEFVPPSAFIFDTSDAGVEFNTTGTKVGYLPKGTSIKCGSCHEGVDVYVNDREEEFNFEDWREARLNELGYDDDDDNNNPPVDPPTGPVEQCNSKEMNEKHDFTPTPDTNCAACHNDGRTCE